MVPYPIISVVCLLKLEDWEKVVKHTSKVSIMTSFSQLVYNYSFVLGSGAKVGSTL